MALSAGRIRRIVQDDMTVIMKGDCWARIISGLVKCLGG